MFPGRASSPVSISIHNEAVRVGKASCIGKNQGGGAFKVPKHAFSCLPVQNTMVANVFAELVHTELKILLCPSSSVLKSTTAFLVLTTESKVRSEQAITSKEQHTSIHGSGAQVAVQHVKTIQKIQSPWLLRQVHEITVTSDVETDILGDRTIISPSEAFEQSSFELTGCIVIIE